MLEEFIEVNKLKAQFVSFSTETPVAVAIKQKKFNPKNIVQINIFTSLKQDEILTITPFGKQPQLEKLEDIVGEELLELNKDECLERTGYAKGSIPPVSIYGIKVFIDSSLEDRGYLIVPINTKKYLKIPLEEVLSFNEDISFEKLFDD